MTNEEAISKDLQSHLITKIMKNEEVTPKDPFSTDFLNSEKHALTIKGSEVHVISVLYVDRFDIGQVPRKVGVLTLELMKERGQHFNPFDYHTRHKVNICGFDCEYKIDSTYFNNRYNQLESRISITNLSSENGDYLWSHRTRESYRACVDLVEGNEVMERYLMEEALKKQKQRPPFGVDDIYFKDEVFKNQSPVLGVDDVYFPE